MNSLLLFLALTILQLLAGFGILSLFRIQVRTGLFISLSVLMGVAVFSVVPFILQLFYIPLTATNIFTALLISCALLNVQIRRGIRDLRAGLQQSRFKMQPYEIVFLTVIGIIVFVSVWRCFYYPPTSRDLTSGAEVIAEYAVREKTMINSLFTVNLETTNNPFKPPFVTSLQIIYKYSGFPFGQVWLCTIFVFFIVFLYHALSMRVHRLIAGFLIIVFLAIPEMYAYSFMVLYDYSNAVFYFLSLYFLFEFFGNGKRNYLAFAGLLMGIATYIRSETLILAFFMALLLCWHHIKNWDSLTKLVISNLFFLFPACFFYFLSVTIYLNYYLPVEYRIGDLVNTNLLDLRPLWQRFYEMNSELIFSMQGVEYYGYFFFIFLIFLVVEIVFSDRWKAEPKTWLYGVLVIYFGYPIMGFLLPLLDLDNSTKRGLFKIFPLMLLYMGNSELLKELSVRIKNWEDRVERLTGM